PVYHGIWREYFLAVMLRRRGRHQSRTFQRAVLAGQVGLLSLLLGVFLLTAMHLTRQTLSAEQRAVQSWIADQTDAYAIKRWYPPVPDGAPDTLLLRVEYRYQSGSKRWVHTNRTFRVTPDSVAELS